MGAWKFQLLQQQYSVLDKCLLPYYGGCDLTRKCMSHRFYVRCGGCLEGFVPNPDDHKGPCLRKFTEI